MDWKQLFFFIIQNGAFALTHQAKQFFFFLPSNRPFLENENQGYFWLSRCCSLIPPFQGKTGEIEKRIRLKMSKCTHKIKGAKNASCAEGHRDTNPRSLKARRLRSAIKLFNSSLMVFKQLQYFAWQILFLKPIIYCSLSGFIHRGFTVP